MKNNFDTIGVVLVIVVFAAVLNNSPPKDRSRKPLFPAFNMESIIKEFHKMTDAMCKVDNFGQMALSSNGVAELAKNVAAPSLPDISNIADTLGPLLKNFNSQN